MTNRCWRLLIFTVFVFGGEWSIVIGDEPESRITEGAPREDALLYRKLALPEKFLTTRKGHTFGGDLRIGDLNGDGRCDFLVYRCNHGAPKGAHMGGMKPTFLGTFDLDGKPCIWSAASPTRSSARSNCSSLRPTWGWGRFIGMVPTNALTVQRRLALGHAASQGLATSRSPATWRRQDSSHGVLPRDPCQPVRRQSRRTGSLGSNGHRCLHLHTQAAR